jgi:DNA adenine methylase
VNTNNIKRPALRYFGGKWRLADWIISHFPPHTCYVEPFAGAASVLIRKETSYAEVYNDLNGMAVNFFKVLRERPDDLVRAIALTPYSRAEYLQASIVTDDALENARRFAAWCWMGRGRGGVVELGGWRFMRADSRAQTPCDDWNNMAHLYEIAARFKRVQIESSDALDCIRRYDTPKTLFYVDPPYVQETRSGRWRTSSYVHEMDDAAHRELASALHAVQGMVILSGYPSPLYDELYKDWLRVETTARTDALVSNRERTEVLWISPNTVKAKAAHCYTPAFNFTN